MSYKGQEKNQFEPIIITLPVTKKNTCLLCIETQWEM